MKKKPLLLLAFLLVLCIGPSIFAISYSHTSIVTEQNLSKEKQSTLADGEAWLEGWDWRKEVTIDPSGSGAETNYQIRVYVTYDNNMQTDFDDIYFTDDDGETKLNYWRETYTASTSAVFWVEVADDLDTIGNIYMYYDNDTVSSASDGDATFLMYEDWTVESMNPARWDLIENNGATSWDDTDADHGSILKLEGVAGANEQSYEAVYDDISPTSIMFRANIEQTLAADQKIRIGSGSPTIFSFAYIEGNAATLRFTVYDDDANSDHQALDAGPFDAYHTFEVTRDGTNAKLYIDYILEETASCDPDIVSTPATFIGVVDSEKDLYVDWIAVRKFVTVDFDVVFGGAENKDTSVATTGSFVGTGEVNSWTSTQSKDGTDWYGDPSCTLTLNFTITSDTYEFDYHVYAYREGAVSGGAWLEVYNFVSPSWVELDTLTDSPAWYNGTVSNSDYMDTTNNVVMLRLDSDFLYYPRWDYAEIRIYYGDTADWKEIAIAEFVLPVGWTPAFQFGYDMFFIVLGLIMIPASTMYLVRGGRKEMSRDKLFLGLIIFVMGLGLLIGGVMP